MPLDIAILTAEHRQFDTQLHRLAVQADALRRDRATDYEPLLCTLECLAPPFDTGSHHYKEALVWKCLARRSDGPRREVEVLNRRLRDVAYARVKLHRAIVDIRCGRTVSPARFGALVRSFVGHFRAQLALEENTIFPLVSRLLHEEDWAAIRWGTERWRYSSWQ